MCITFTKCTLNFYYNEFIMNIHFPVDVYLCVDAWCIKVLWHSFQTSQKEKSNSHLIFCDTSTVCSKSYDLLISAVTAACTTSSNYLHSVCQGKHKENLLSPVAVCVLQTTLFSVLQWLSCKSLLTWLFSFSFCHLCLSQGYGFQPSYDGDELSCTIRNLHRSTKYKFRVRKPCLQSKLVIRGFNLGCSGVRMCGKDRLQTGRVLRPTVAQ